MATDRILEEHLGHDAVVMTTVSSVVEGGDGNIMQVPLIYSGIIMDFDSRYVLMVQEDQTLIAVSRRVIAALERPSNVSKVMSDPSKPDKSQMS